MGKTIGAGPSGLAQQDRSYKMDYTVIARKREDGKPITGTFEVAKRDDRRIGARGWWGGRSMMSLLAAEREVARRNAGAAPPATMPAVIEEAGAAPGGARP
jgi:hypothetical protein